MQKTVITKDVFAATFQLPTEGMVGFTDLLEKVVSVMKMRFSITDVSFRPPNKKKEMKVECQLLHDIVAKALCAKAGSFDVVTSTQFDLMVAIGAGLKVNWGHILFQTLVAMVHIPSRQSQVFAVQMSILLEKVVKADLGESVKLHPLKLLNNRYVLYMKKNLSVGPAAEERGYGEEEAGGESGREEAKGVSGDGEETNGGWEPSWSSEVQAGSSEERSKMWSLTQAAAMQDVDKEHSTIVRSEPEQPAQQSMMSAGKDIFAPVEIRVINWATHFLPKIDPNSKGKEILEAPAEPSGGALSVGAQLSLTELVSELLERRMLVLYKLYDTELKKRVDEHQANFYPAEPSANYDHMCIQFLDCEQKLNEVQQVVVSLHSKVVSLDSKLICLDSKVDRMMDTQTYMKHDSTIFKRAFYQNMDEVVANVNSSQKALETSLHRASAAETRSEISWTELTWLRSNQLRGLETRAKLVKDKPAQTIQLSSGDAPV
ncbi:hypothetical protein F511_38013 [Dorcoceras hygrometricum]|uniref:Uncharacterized protein n=1 Tax=Dorcoceras hygrometricum TaxID=472368 RepID=A0A2Z7A275_9LAMI|nr:hypothetical protein F511_38013 [Dorcoceras hygrometricum]